MAKAAIDAYFVCGGKYHDIDYARLQLLGLLGEHERIRTRMAEDYRDIEAIEASDFLVTYTVDVVPDEATALAIARLRRRPASAGSRCTARIRCCATSRAAAGKHRATRARSWRRSAASSSRTRRSHRIASRPPSPTHPLVAGIEPFDADDELYLSELHPPLQVLLHTRWTGEAKGFTERDWSRDEPRPVMYLKQVGDGEVLYLTLGHARGHYDMRPLMDEYPHGRARQLEVAGVSRTAATRPALGRAARPRSPTR